VYFFRKESEVADEEYNTIFGRIGYLYFDILFSMFGAKDLICDNIPV
jgi:hypothetical protein